MSKERMYLNSTEIANRLGVTRRTIYRYLQKGMPCANVGHYRFDAKAVDDWFFNYKAQRV